MGSVVGMTVGRKEEGTAVGSIVGSAVGMSVEG